MTIAGNPGKELDPKTWYTILEQVGWTRRTTDEIRSADWQNRQRLFGAPAGPARCIAAADTFEETRNLIEEAANFHVEGMLEDGDTVPQPNYSAVEVEIPALDVPQQVAIETGG